MTTYDWERLTSDVVCKFSTRPDEPLLPWPELPQDLAFLAFVIDAQRRELDETRQGRELEQQMLRNAAAVMQGVRDLPGKWVDEQESYPDSEQGAAAAAAVRLCARELSAALGEAS